MSSDNFALGHDQFLGPFDNGRLMQCFNAGISVEVASRDEADLAAHLGARTAVFLPWLPTTTPSSLLETARRCFQLGLRPIPHLAARRIDDGVNLGRLIEKLNLEAGVRELLVVGGEVATPAGKFGCAMDLLQSGAVEGGGIKAVGIAGYPEGHPAISKAELDKSLTRKVLYAGHHGLDVFVVSQFCFDANAMVNWVRGVRAQEIAAPIRIGIAGPTDLHKLIRLGMRCGIGESLRFLRGKGGMVARLATTYDPDQLLNALVNLLAETPITGPLALHVYAFGGARSTGEWVRKHTDPAISGRG